MAEWVNSFCCLVLSKNKLFNFTLNLLQLLIWQRHLQIVRDLERLRDYYYDEYTRLLENKVNKQKQEIRERSDAFLNKIMEFKETEV